MRASIYFLLSVLCTSTLLAQYPGYYNGTEGLDGNELKSALHDIIKDHKVFTYSDAKTILKYADADPNSTSNVILVYTGRSHPAMDYGVGGNQLNREHVWAKSHGGFDDVYPMFSDVHNLKPADASVNQSRSNKDFDNGGVPHSEAAGCFYTDYTWEARDAVKGDIARIIFYMASRYEGGPGEIDLEVVDKINTYPYPEHGRLSTLLEWNQADPPDEFERKRNEVIFGWQENRNPFIDHPRFASLIWGGEEADNILISHISIQPDHPHNNEPVIVSANITTEAGSVEGATVRWGPDRDYLDQSLEMVKNANEFTGELPGQNAGQHIFFKIEASDGTKIAESPVYAIILPDEFEGDLLSIYEIQGQQYSSPFENQYVITTGIVTGKFGDNYFIQDYPGAWNGLNINDPENKPAIGDSIVIRGRVIEYFGLTQLSNITDYYLVGRGHALPAAEAITTGDAGESYESVLIEVMNAECTDADYQSNYDMWMVDDGSGELLVQNHIFSVYEPEKGDYYNIIGPLSFTYGEYKIMLRSENDVTEGVSFISSLDLTSQLHIFPNPSTGHFNIDFFSRHDKIDVLQVFDNFGRLIYSEEYDLEKGENNLQLELGNYTRGIYYLQFGSGNGQFMNKIILLQ